MTSSGIPPYPPSGAPDPAQGQPAWFTPAPPAPSVGDALSWAWQCLRDNPGPLIVGTLVWSLLADGLVVSSHAGRAAGLGEGLQGLITINAGGLVGLVLSVLSQVALAHVALTTAAGRQARWRDLVTFPNLVSMLVAVIVTTVGVAIGTILLILPGLVLSFLWHFTILAGVDGNLGPFEAMGRSWRLISSQPLAMLGFAATGVALYLLGLITLIGWIVTVPLVMLMEVYAFVALTGRQVVA